MRFVAALPSEHMGRTAALLGFEAPVPRREAEAVLGAVSASDAVLVSNAVPTSEAVSASDAVLASNAVLASDAVPASEAVSASDAVLASNAARVSELESEPALTPGSEPAPTPAPVAFWRIEEMTFADELESEPPSPEPFGGLTDDDLRSPGRSLFATPPAPPLAAWSRLWPVLRAVLQASVPGRNPDVPALLRAWSRGEIVRCVPRVPQRTWTERASIWVDRSPRLVPFWSDQSDVCRRLRTTCGHSGLQVRLLDGRTQAGSIARHGNLLAGFRPAPGTPVLVLGDLGAYGSPGERAAWLRTARRLRRAGVRVAALVPSPEARWDPRVGKAWAAVPWERGRRRGGVVGRREPRFWEERAERLLRLASPAALVQPGLLREMRRLLPASEADAATEADAWSHADVRAADSTGLVLHVEATERLRRQFAADVEADVKRRVSAAIGRWHEALPKELLRAETLVWHALVPGAVAAPPGDIADAQAFVQRLAVSARRGGGDPALMTAARRYGRTLLAAMPDAVYDAIPSLKIVWAAASQGVTGVHVPPSIDARAVYEEIERAGEPRWWGVHQVGGRLVFAPSASGEWPSWERGPGSPVAWLVAARPEMIVKRGQDPRGTQILLNDNVSIPLHPGEGIQLRTDRCAVTVRPWRKEPWATAAGRDRFGLWADTEVNGVLLGFRWIPPGRVRMGSPMNEWGRQYNEGPQHLVTWTTGLWLADTPLTQGLWEAVMGDNPSRFRSADRPVETVSWEDCHKFLRRLNALVPGLDARLPNEAEWEYACRAGTDTATWLGDLNGQNDALLLDPIAWWTGNAEKFYWKQRSYVGQAAHIALWPQKPHDRSEDGTAPVQRKEPNPLGLHDMLGNVYEWCLDAWSEDLHRDLTKPPATDRWYSRRVIRGGSWKATAGNIRAAHRWAHDAGHRADALGFRLARGRLVLRETLSSETELEPRSDAAPSTRRGLGPPPGDGMA
ncbi:SUMF1/EgtB/PvdO family nonheme iron enzyme [Sorangium sp. So ce1151]|uniref:formylglycine-generating enzyme family protein n=1 Tax=Sorangium sp. So ce1151 TaxID=3133332 RepID=UPI003F5FB19A